MALNEANHESPLRHARCLCLHLAGKEWKMSYHRIIGRNVWHFHERCHHMKRIIKRITTLTGGNFRITKPRSGEFCDECRSKAKKDRRRRK